MYVCIKFSTGTEQRNKIQNIVIFFLYIFICDFALRKGIDFLIVPQRNLFKSFLKGNRSRCIIIETSPYSQRFINISSPVLSKV